MTKLTQSQKAHSDLNTAILHKTLVFYHLPFHFQVFLCLRLPIFLQVLYRESMILFFFSDMTLHFLQCFVSLIINPYSHTHTHTPVIPTCTGFCLCFDYALVLPFSCSIYLIVSVSSGSLTVCSFHCMTRQIRGWFSFFDFIPLPTSPHS